jgi:multiple sugar transport system substrate-binding protein
MVSRRSRIASVLATVALFVAVACNGGGGATGGAGTGSGAIKIWSHQGPEGEVKSLQKAVADFNASQSDIKATLQFVPEGDYTKTVQATKPGSLPDVLEFDGPLLQSFVRAKKLGPITGLISSQTADNQIASVQPQDTVNGKLYGVAMFDSGLGIYGNKKMLDEAGVKYPTSLGGVWTADQFEAELSKLAAKSPGGKALDIKENYAGEWPTYGFLPIVSSAGGTVMKDGKAEGNLDSDKVVAATKKFASWKKWIDPNTADDAFIKGKVALSWVGHWMYPTYSKALGSDLVVMPLPDFGNGSKTGQGSWAWGINPSSSNGKAAGKFLDFLMNDDNITAMTQANGAVPGTKTTVAKSELYRQGGPLYLFTQQLEKTCGTKAPTKDCVAVPRTLTAGYPVISREFSQAFFAAYNGSDAKTELTKAAKAIDVDFKDNDGYKIG